MDSNELNHLVGLVERVAREAAIDQVRIELERRSTQPTTTPARRTMQLDERVLGILRSRGPLTVRAMQMTLRGSARAEEIRTILEQHVKNGLATQNGAFYRIA